jgi:hypothetical protein
MSQNSNDERKTRKDAGEPLWTDIFSLGKTVRVARERKHTKEIEYAVRRGFDPHIDVDHMEGKDWRAARKLAAECEAGLHPEIASIERVERWLEWGSEVDSDYQEIYRRDD